MNKICHKSLHDSHLFSFTMRLEERIRTTREVLAVPKDELTILLMGDTQYHYKCEPANIACKRSSKRCRESYGLDYVSWFRHFTFSCNLEQSTLELGFISAPCLAIVLQGYRDMYHTGFSRELIRSESPGGWKSSGRSLWILPTVGTIKVSHQKRRGPPFSIKSMHKTTQKVDFR